MNSFTVGGLFSGVGGIELGFQQAGFKTVWANEFDKYSAKTYRLNHGKHLIEDDIHLIQGKDLEPVDVLVGGFPCQAFSQAGLKKGFHDSRGTLFFEIQKILVAKKPKAFLLENVKGLKSHDGGNTLKTIIRVLNSDLKYHLHVDVLNAKNFGLSQNRERIFIVGFKDQTGFDFPHPPMIKTRLGDILHKRASDKFTISDRIWTSHQMRKKRARDEGYGFGYSLFNRDSEYTSTISARYYKDGSEILIEQKDKNPRMLTPREAARLQGFPEEFEIPVSNNQAYKQFGNAVPVSVIRALAKEMIKNF